MSSRYALLLLLSLAFPAAVAAQQADILTGRVTGEDGQPVMGARVEALSLETELTRSAITGRDGRYLIVFPDGGGIYLLQVSFIGMADEVRPLVREASEELLLANFTLFMEAIDLEGFVVEVQGTTYAGETAAETVVLSQDLLGRLPLQDLEPGTVALLAPGVVGTAADSLSDRMQFTVGGMREELNQVTLDGVSIGDTPIAVPEEGVRRVQVTTSTFDVSQGGFAGGQVSVTTARGNNLPSGSLTYDVDSQAFQLRGSPTANAYTRHNIGGSWGGPILQNRLFYNASFQLTRNENHRFALTPGDPLAAQRSGVSVDSIARFLSILEHDHGVPPSEQTGAYSHLSSDVRLQGRLDWNIVQGSRQSHSLSTRFNTNVNGQDSTRISTLDVMQHGGETEGDTRQVSLNLTSQLGRRWTNVLDLSMQQSWSDAKPYLEVPEGQVRITSEFEDGTRGSKSLTFGGNRNMPTEASARDFKISEELSIVQPLGDQIHRLKLGGSLETSRTVQRATSNLFGAFRFGSLEDFGANRPDRFERTLTEREAESGRLTAALFLGDTWRVSQPLEITLGLRWDLSRLTQRPEHNPAVEVAFGRRTDIVPSSAAWSPRVGVSYNFGGAGDGGREGGGRSRGRSLTGGIGYFAGRAPLNIFSAALRQTGLPNAEQSLICIGSAVPLPDWDLYYEDPTAIPSTCVEGEAGTAQSTRAPSVTLIQPNQRLPGSLRLDAGYRTPLPLGLTANLGYQYSLGRGLWGYRDLNLEDSRAVMVGERMFFGDPAAISARTGAVSLSTSRKDPTFANVFDVSSSLRSVAHQFTAQINGTLPPRVRTNLNYTLAFARDQGSGSLAQVTTAGNPNFLEWATSSNDRRHNLSLSLTYAVNPSLEVAANGRLQSGMPFTPIVNRDVNGDGLRNDRAFVHDPRAVPDTTIANGMNRLLANVPGRVRDCLEGQFGTVAGRNSCRGAWTQTFNVRASFRPMLPNLRRRVTFTADLRNVLTGADYLFNGRSGMKGWGEGQRPDANLLEVQSFDRDTNTFRYQVNEGFGQDNRGPEAFRNAFSLSVSARVALGGNPAQQSRGFINPPTARREGGDGDGSSSATGFQLPTLTAMLRAGDGEDPDVDSIVGTLLDNPVARVLALIDSLGLSVEPSAVLEGIADTLQARLDERREPLTGALWALVPDLREAPGGLLGAGSDAQLRFQADVQPHVEGARRDVAAAMRRVQQTVDEGVWTALPPDLRGMVTQALDAPRPGQPQGFSAIGTLDRMLANPLPVLLALEDVLKLEADQVDAVKAVSDSLQERLDRRRESLGRRFDNVPVAEQARIFQQIQPEIEAGREEIRVALRSVESLLTSEQWGQVPAAVRDPFAPARQRDDPGG